MMMKLIKKDKYIPIILIAFSFIWAGMILGISFLEAPLKFQAPNITLALGVGIGRLIFSALNKIELLFCVLSWMAVLLSIKNTSIYTLLLMITTILAIQSLWLLPALDQRALIVMAGNPSPPDSPHLYYIVTEVLKLGMLIIIGIIGIKYIIAKHLANES